MTAKWNEKHEVYAKPDGTIYNALNWQIKPFMQKEKLSIRLPYGDVVDPGVIIMETFVCKQPGKGYFVKRQNGDQEDVRLVNLFWAIIREVEHKNKFNNLNKSKKSRRFTLAQVETIRDRLKDAPRGIIKRLAEEYGVSPNCIADIKKGRTYSTSEI